MSGKSMSITISLAIFSFSFAITDTILVKVLPPYPNEKGIVGFGYSILNALHINSRQWMVRRLLPIRRGDVLDSVTILETERILRAYPFWDSAKITVSDDSSMLFVDVHELWTTKLNAAAQYVVQELEWSLSSEEENFFGLGAYLTAGYSHYFDGDWWNFATKIYGFPFRGWDLSARYRYTKSGWIAGGNISRSDAYNIGGDIAFISATIESISIPLVQSGGNANDTIICQHKFSQFEYLFKKRDLFYGIAFGYEDRAYDPEEFRAQSNSWIPLVGRVAYLSRIYAPMRNVNNFARIEDIPTGWKATAALGLNIAQKLDYTEDAFVSLSAANASIIKNHYWAWQAGFASKYGDKNLHLLLRTFTPVDDESIFRLGFGADCVLFSYHNPYRFFIADSRLGFRGFPACYSVQYGDGTYTKLSGELRMFPEFEFLTIRPGFALFADIGGVSDEFLPDKENLLFDVGISFRLASTRSTTGNVNRFEFSYIPKTRTFAFTLDSEQAFSFFLPISLSPVLPP